MKKKVINLRSLIVMCVFALMMGLILIPQTVSADNEDSDTIYWSLTSSGSFKGLVISDQELTEGTTTGSFPADEQFTAENPAPWGSPTFVRVEGTPAPLHTDYWFSGCRSLFTADLYGLDLSNCESMTGMFDGCTSLGALTVGPAWSNLPTDNAVRASFPDKMYRTDIKPNQIYDKGALMPEYIPSDARMNIYVHEQFQNEVHDWIPNGNLLAKFLARAYALPGITDPAELQRKTETARALYNRLGDLKSFVPDEALAAFRDAGGFDLPQKIIIRWSSRDGEDFVEPLSFDIPEGGIKYSQFLDAHRSEIFEHFKSIDHYNDDYAPYGGDPIGFEPMTEFLDDPGEYTNLMATSDLYTPVKNLPNRSMQIKEFTELYFYSFKRIKNINFMVDPLVCGTEIHGPYSTELSLSESDADKVNPANKPVMGAWSTSSNGSAIDGKVVGGHDYYVTAGFTPALGYNQNWTNIFVNNKFVLNGSLNFSAPVTAVHDPDSNGICRGCGEKVNGPNNQPGTDGTPVGPGSSAETAEQAITSMTSDTDPKGSVFSKLAFKSTKQAKNSISLSWNKVGGAKSFVIYGNKCGKGIKPVKIATSTGNAMTVKTISGKSLAKGTYYKFIIVALDQDNKVVSTSKLIHVATSGGKVGNHKKVTVKKAVTKKAKKLKKGKSLKLKAKAVKKSKKVKKHVGVRYESTNTKIATVSAKGVVKGNSKGTCYVYAYAQNGVSKKIKVTVK